ncbi:DUF3618 domain-containing protein [Aeromicrobium sp. CTD01-1L150]|uniref:DUF3618 domain-containing protein n=1 Tax=Aeromicrobium sp. CTD01-1L150 TaxID=3341830 RepID=UPI0035BFE0C8
MSAAEERPTEELIAQATANLAEDVDALSEKLDVKAHARDAVADVRARATDERARRIAGLLAVGAVATVGALLWRRRS